VREPLLHFALAGVGVFLLYAYANEHSPVADDQIVVTTGQIERIVTLFERTRQHAPTEQELRSLIDDYVLEEVLYREAKKIGLDQDDAIIRRRLEQKMALLAGVPYLPGGKFEVAARLQIAGDELQLSEGTIAVGGMNGTAGGRVSLGSDAGAFGLELSVSGADLSDALRFGWLDRMSGEAFAIQGRLEHRAGHCEFESVSASIGDFDINADSDFMLADLTGELRLTAKAPHVVELGKLIGGASLPEGPLSVSGRIKKGQNDFEFSGVNGSIGEYFLDVDGMLSTSPKSNRSDLQFSGSGPDLHEIRKIFQYEDLSAKPFNLSGAVNGNATGFALERFMAKIGDNEIVGGFTADLSGKPEVTGSLTSSFLDLRRQLAREEYDAKEPGSGTGELLFSDQPFDVEWLDSTNLDMSVSTDHLILGFGDVRDFRIGIKLRDRALAIDPMSFRETEGNVSASLHMTPVNGTYGLDLSVNVDNMHFGLLGGRGQDRRALPSSRGQLTLNGSGRSLHEIMASSNGRLALTQGRGRLRDMTISPLFGDLISQVIRTLNPAQKPEEFTNLDCGVYTIDVVDGLATFENFAMQTKRIAFVARGNINFKNEEINLTMNASPREGLGISIGNMANSFLKFGGTLMDPKLELDPTASVATTGAAAATGGLSLLAKGLWDRLKAQGDICKDLQQSAKQAHMP
jgi:hypothetical protein